MVGYDEGDKDQEARRGRWLRSKRGDVGHGRS